MAEKAVPAWQSCAYVSAIVQVVCVTSDPIPGAKSISNSLLKHTSSPPPSQDPASSTFCCPKTSSILGPEYHQDGEKLTA
jgi:hypothetical protein